MLGSISKGTTRIKNLLMGDDIRRTIEAFRAMGVSIEITSSPSSADPRNDIVVHGVGMRGMKKPGKALYLGNSGTTMRILPGILAGQDFEVVLKGDTSLSKRPMRRIVEPLVKMGVRISGKRLKVKGIKEKEIFPPIEIHGGRIKPIRHNSKIASAQVKSCILLAGLFAKGITSVTEPVRSRDHTERMLRIFGCRLKASPGGVYPEQSRGARDRQDSGVSLRGPVRLRSPQTIEIPGDVSSAAFFIVAGCILPDMKIIIKNVGLNPTRTGSLDILKKMGADISFRPRASSLEPYGDIIVKGADLKGVRISPGEVVRAIDEMPIIMVAACFAKGVTVIHGAGELRVKETDRINSMVTNLKKMGAEIEVKGERLKVRGGRPLHGARVSSYGDHRTAMSMLVAGLVLKCRIKVTGLGCINKSFPGFLDLLEDIRLLTH